ncbi:hypothetical protein FRC17_000433 [Serendipita sp. 399]|nr:hypothetical protein FRC17_000433 [Serendipita sp. 399]
MAVEPPPLSPAKAWLLSGYFAISYVASLYTFRAGRLVFTAQQTEVGPNAERARALNERWRNDPATIKARLLGVSLSTVLEEFRALKETLSLLGLTGIARVPLGAWFLAPLMYTGPLYVQALDQELPFQKKWSFNQSVAPIFGTWLGFRNILAAPVTEELVFRSCIIGAMKLSGASNLSMIFLSPLWFGAAHLHHGWDLYNRFGKTKAALKRAVMSIGTQVSIPRKVTHRVPSLPAVIYQHLRLV